MIGQQYIKGANVFITCCPWWLATSPAVSEIMQAVNWKEKGNAGAWCGGDANLTVATRNAMSGFEQGYHEGLNARLKEDREKDKRKASR